MGIFWTLFIYLLIVFVFSSSLKGDKRRINQTVFAGFGVWLVLALRSPLCGVDLVSYSLLFDEVIKSSWSDILRSSSSSEFMGQEMGWLIYNKLFSLITSDFQWFIAITAGITLFFIGFVFYKYSSNIIFSFLIYATFGLYIFSFSGIRQALAISITFMSFHFLKNKKNLWFVIFVLIASTMHSSAIIFLVAWPLSKLKISFIKGLVIVLGIGILMPFMRTIVNTIVALIFTSRYENYQDEGGAIVLLLVYVLIFLFSFAGAKGAKNERLQFFQWMILCAVGCQSLGFISTGAITRIGYYFTIFFPLIIPEIFTGFRRPSFKIIATVVTSILLIIFFYLTTKGGYLDVVPYRFFWETPFAL